MGEAHDDIIERVLSLRCALKAQRIKIDKPYTMPVLGLLAILTADINEIVQSVVEAVQLMRLQKGFGVVSVTKQELLIFAAALVGSEYAERLKANSLASTLSSNIASIIIAQQAAMIINFAAATSVVVASTSS